MFPSQRTFAAIISNLMIRVLTFTEKLLHIENIKDFYFADDAASIARASNYGKRVRLQKIVVALKV
jgi:hypothetical protein